MVCHDPEVVILIDRTNTFRQNPSNLKFHLMHQHSHPVHQVHVPGEEQRKQLEVLDICLGNISDLFCCLVCCYVPPKLPRHGRVPPRGGLCCSCFINADIEKVMNMHPLHRMRHHHHHPNQGQFVDEAAVREQQATRHQILRRLYLARFRESPISSQNPVPCPQQWAAQHGLLQQPA